MISTAVIYLAVWMTLLLHTAQFHDRTRGPASSFILAALLALWPLSVPAIAVARAIARR